MGAPIVDPNATPVKVTHINNTRAVLQANLKPCQLGWETDYHCLGFSDEAGTYHSISIDDSLAHDHDDRYYTETEMGTLLAAKESVANKGVANGYASLDSAGKVPVTQLPNSIMEYKGSWNASTNIPTLAAGVGNTGDVYRVSVAGIQFGISFVAGDYCIYNGSTWEKSDATDAVTSVDGYQGAVNLAGKYVSIAGTETITGAKTFSNITTFGGSIIGSGSAGLVLVNNTSDGLDNKTTLLCGGGSYESSRGATIALRGNENAGHGNLELSAGSGSGGITGSVSVSPRMYFGARPENDLFWRIALGDKSTLHSDGSLKLMQNCYYSGDWFTRTASTGAAAIYLNDGAFGVYIGNQTAANAAMNGVYAIFSNSIANTALGKTTLVGGNRLEVEGNTFVNGTTKTKKINTSTPETIALTTNTYINYSTKTGNFFRFTTTVDHVNVWFTNVPIGDVIYVFNASSADLYIRINNGNNSGNMYFTMGKGFYAAFHCIALDDGYPIFAEWCGTYIMDDLRDKL